MLKVPKKPCANCCVFAIASLIFFIIVRASDKKTFPAGVSSTWRLLLVNRVTFICSSKDFICCVTAVWGEIYLVNIKHTKSPGYNYFHDVPEIHLVNLKPQICYIYTCEHSIAQLIFLLKN